MSPSLASLITGIIRSTHITYLAVSHVETEEQQREIRFTGMLHKICSAKAGKF